MGRELFYCARCGNRLTGDDLAAGKARQAGEGTYCTGCVPAGAAPSPSPAQPVQPPRGSSSKHPRIHAPESAPGSRLPMLLGVAGGSLLAVLLLGLALRPSPPPAASSTASAPPPAQAPAPPPRADPSDDLHRRMNEAAAELKRIAGRDPARGLKVWEEARKRFESPDWTELAEAQIRSLRKQVDELEAMKSLQPDDVANLWVRTKKPYAWVRPERGLRLFLDRDYTLHQVPALLANGLVLKGSNEDKTVKDAPLLRFQLKREAEVYVTLDPRRLAYPWLRGWEKIPETLPMSERPLQLYRKRFAPGWVEIGPSGDPKVNNVVVFVVPPQ